jgi:predicted transcriptional regulator
MDEHKDIQKSNRLSRLYGEYSVKTNPFGDNKSAERAYRRVERLSMALYLLTNHVPESEPLRNSIRSEIIKLGECILELRDELRAVESVRLSSTRSLIRHIISLIHLLVAAGYISVQNGEVASSALDDLGMFINSSQRSPLSEYVSLTHDDFLDQRMSFTGQKESLKDTSHITDTDKEKDKDMSVTKSDSVQLKNRANSILEILRSGGEQGIKDISAHVPEYSEKMIQRVLADLIKNGQVKKSGSKRWSRYSLGQ